MTRKSCIIQKQWRINFFPHTFWNICEGKNFFHHRYFKKYEWKNWFLISSFLKIPLFPVIFSWIIWKKTHFAYFYMFGIFIFGIFIFITLTNQNVEKEHIFLLKFFHFSTNSAHSVAFGQKWPILQGSYFPPVVRRPLNPHSALIFRFAFVAGIFILDQNQGCRICCRSIAVIINFTILPSKMRRRLYNQFPEIKNWMVRKHILLCRYFVIVNTQHVFL